jgi:hypothetical protein
MFAELERPERDVDVLSSPTAEMKQTRRVLLSLSIRLYGLAPKHRPNNEISVKHNVCEYCVS